MKPIFTPINPERWARMKYFDYFYNKIKTRYNLTKNIDISLLIDVKNQKGFKFYPTMLYALTRAVNQNVEFRMSFNPEGILGYWNYVNPAYTIFHNDDKTFSDIWSEYNENFKIFYSNVCTDMETYKDVKEIKARPNQPANF